MGQVLHGWATTSEAVRRAIQHSQKSLRALAKHYGINQKTAAKWRKRSSIADLPTRPERAEIHSAIGRGRSDHRRLSLCQASMIGTFSFAIETLARQFVRHESASAALSPQAGVNCQH
jgi:hypothetical protein